MVRVFRLLSLNLPAFVCFRRHWNKSVINLSVTLKFSYLWFISYFSILVWCILFERRCEALLVSLSLSPSLCLSPYPILSVCFSFLFLSLCLCVCVSALLSVSLSLSVCCLSVCLSSLSFSLPVSLCLSIFSQSDLQVNEWIDCYFSALISWHNFFSGNLRIYFIWLFL